MQTSNSHLSNSQKISLIQTICQQKALTLIKQQSSHYEIEIAQLKLRLKQNQDKLLKQQTYLADLSNKIGLIQQRSLAKAEFLRRQLEDFRGYYSQCYEYTLSRVNEVAFTAYKMIEEVQRSVKEVSTPFSTLQFVKYTYQLVAKIIKQSSLKNVSLRYELLGSLNELQLELGKIREHIQCNEQAIVELQIIKYLNQTTKDTTESMIKRIEERLEMESQNKQYRQITQEYEIKLKQIKKIITSCTIEAEMISLSTSNAAQSSGKYDKDQKKRLQNKIAQLDEELVDQRGTFERIIQKKDELIRKKQEKILQLSEQIQQFDDLHSRKDKQLILLKNQNKELIKLMNQARNISQEKQRLEKMYDIKSKDYESKISDLTARLQISVKKKSFQQKNTRRDRLQQRQLVITHTSKTHHTTTSKIDLSSDQESTKSQPCTYQQQSHQDWKELVKENEKLLKNNKQLCKYKKELEEQLDRLLKEKERENQEENFYLDTMEAEAQQNLKEIQRLTTLNSTLKKQNDELWKENQKIKVQINSFVLRFQQQTANLRDYIAQLEAEIQRLVRKSSSNKNNGKLHQKSPDLSSHPHDLQLTSPPKTVLTDSVQAKQKNFRKILSKQQRQLIYFLKEAIMEMGWNTPIHCCYEKVGYMKQRKSGAYLVDSEHKRIRLSPAQIRVGIQNDLFVI